MSDILKRIMEIGYQCDHDKKQMTFQELSNLLNKQGFSVNTGRGLAKRVAAAFHRAEKENNPGVADAIARVFVDENGKHYWEQH